MFSSNAEGIKVMDSQEIMRQTILRHVMMQRLNPALNHLHSIQPLLQPAPKSRILDIQAGVLTVRTVPYRHPLLGLGGVSYPGEHWDDLSLEMRLLLASNPGAVIAAFKKAKFEIPKAILRALREFRQSVRRSGSLEAAIKAILRPLKFIPKSLHPIDSVA